MKVMITLFAVFSMVAMFCFSCVGSDDDATRDGGQDSGQGAGDSGHPEDAGQDTGSPDEDAGSDAGDGGSVAACPIEVDLSTVELPCDCYGTVVNSPEEAMPSCTLTVVCCPATPGLKCE